MVVVYSCCSCLLNSNTDGGESDIVQNRFLLWLKILDAELLSSPFPILLVYKIYCSYVLTMST